MTPLSDPYLENGDLNYFPNPLNTSGYNPLANDVPGQFADAVSYTHLDVYKRQIFRQQVSVCQVDV